MLSNGAHDQRVQGYASGGSLSPKETLIDFHPDATGAADDGFAAALDTRVVCSWIFELSEAGELEVGRAFKLVATAANGGGIMTAAQQVAAAASKAKHAAAVAGPSA